MAFQEEGEQRATPQNKTTMSLPRERDFKAIICFLFICHNRTLVPHFTIVNLYRRKRITVFFSVFRTQQKNNQK